MSKYSSVEKSDSSPVDLSGDFSGDLSVHDFAPYEFNASWATTARKPGGFFRREWDSFKRDPNRRIVARTLGADGRVFDAQAAAQGTADSPLQKHLKARHLQMIAFGGSIGTGLFVGSGKALSNGGPASVVIAFCLVGIMLYCTVQALGEMAVAFPVTGSFSTYSTRFLDPAWGFAMGWNYAMNWLIVLPLEIVAASITIEYWNTSILMNGLWVTIFLLIIVGINLFGVKGYGEAEFVFSIIKITAIIGFIILGIVLNIAGGPDGTYIGGQYWHTPGAFHNGFKGLCSTFVTAAFAFAGTELVGLTAAETSNPRKTLPTAIKQVFWRICIFYIVSLTLIGLLIPYTDPRLIGSNAHDTRASPFVIAISNAGIQGLDSVMNGVIMLAVLSVGNSAVYGSSRTLAALAEQHQAPRFLAYIDRRGRPLAAITLAASLGLLAYLATSPAQEAAFAWMLAVCGLSSLITWGSICLAHIRFRAAWRYQGRGLDALAFRAQCGVAGSWVGLFFTILGLAAQFWTGFAPIGWQDNTPLENVQGFFQAYLAAPVVLACYGGYKVWFRTRIMRSRDVDLVTGMRDVHLPEQVSEEEGLRQAWPRWKRVYKFLC